MADPFQIVGDRVARAVEKNNPKDGKHYYNASKSKLYIREQDLVFGEVVPGAINPLTLKRSEFINNSTVQNSQAFTVEETTTESYTWSMTNALKVSTTFEAKVPFVGGTKNTIEINTSVTSSETQTESRKWSYASTIYVPPKRKIVTSFIVNEATYHVPFDARVVVRGTIYTNNKGNKKTFNRDIDYLINNLNWNPNTFKVKTDGIMDAIVGHDYRVLVDEYELDGTPVARNQVIARGTWQDPAPQLLPVGD